MKFFFDLSVGIWLHLKSNLVRLWHFKFSVGRCWNSAWAGFCKRVKFTSQLDRLIYDPLSLTGTFWLDKCKVHEQETDQTGLNLTGSDWHDTGLAQIEPDWNHPKGKTIQRIVRWFCLPRLLMAVAIVHVLCVCMYFSDSFGRKLEGFRLPIFIIMLCWTWSSAEIRWVRLKYHEPSRSAFVIPTSR